MLSIFKYLLAATVMCLVSAASAMPVVKSVDGYRPDWFEKQPINKQGSLTESTCNAKEGFSFRRIFAQYPSSFSNEQLQQVWNDDKDLKEQADWYLEFDSKLNKTQLFVRSGVTAPADILALDTQRGGPPPKPTTDCRNRKPLPGPSGGETIRSVLTKFASAKQGPVTVRLPNDRGTAKGEVVIDGKDYLLMFTLPSSDERKRIIEAFDEYMTQEVAPYENVDSISPTGRAYQERIYEVKGNQNYAVAVYLDPAAPSDYMLEVASLKPEKPVKLAKKP